MAEGRTQADYEKNGNKMKNLSAGKKKAVSPRLIIITCALIVAVITFLVFMPTFQNEFLIWDDDTLVTDNLHIQKFNMQTIKHIFTSVGITIWYPITMLSFALDHAVWGLDPKGFHLTNNILHSLNAFLVFMIAYCLVYLAGDDKEGLNVKAIVAAAVTALLFALHPLRVESVAWIAERKDVTYSFFYLLSIFMYLKYATAESGGRKFYIISIAVFAVSLMSKPMAVTLPLVLLILDHYPLGRLFGGKKGENTGRIILEKVPYILLSAMMSASTIITNVDSGSLMSLDTHPLYTRVLVAARAYIFYLYKAIVPQDLAPYYPYPRNIVIFSAEYTGAILIFLFLTAISLYLFRKRKAVTAAWFYYLITLVPVIGIVQLGSYAAANRYTYLPMLGPFLLVGIMAGSAFSRPGRKALQAVTVIAVLAVLIMLARITVRDIPQWKDTLTLWTYQINIYPDRVPIAYTNRGIAHDKAGNTLKAIEDYSKSIQIDSKYVKAYNNRGVAYINLNMFKEALKDYTMAIKLNPGMSQVYNNRGVLYGRLGEYDKTIDDCTKAIELDPGIPDSYYNRGIAFFELKRYEEAIRDYSMTIRIHPRHVKAINNRGNAYRELNQYEAAVRDYTRAIELSPKRVEFYFNRGNSYMKLEDYPASIRDFTSAISIDPKMSQAYNNRANSYNRIKKLDLAIKDYQSAINVDPDNATAYFNAALLYLKTGDKKNALAGFKKASSLGLKQADRYLKKRKKD